MLLLAMSLDQFLDLSFRFTDAHALCRMPALSACLDALAYQSSVMAYPRRQTDLFYCVDQLVF